MHGEVPDFDGLLEAGLDPQHRTGLPHRRTSVSNIGKSNFTEPLVQ